MTVLHARDITCGRCVHDEPADEGSISLALQDAGYAAGLVDAG